MLTILSLDHDFIDINGVPHIDNLSDDHGSMNTIDLDDVEEDAEIVIVGSSNKQQMNKQNAKYWEHFKLATMGATVDG